MNLKDIEEKGSIGLGDQEDTHKGLNISQIIHIAGIKSMTQGYRKRQASETKAKINKWLPQDKTRFFLEKNVLRKLWLVYLVLITSPDFPIG